MWLNLSIWWEQCLIRCWSYLNIAAYYCAFVQVPGKWAGRDIGGGSDRGVRGCPPCGRACRRRCRSPCFHDSKVLLFFDLKMLFIVLRLLQSFNWKKCIAAVYPCRCVVEDYVYPCRCVVEDYVYPCRRVVEDYVWQERRTWEIRFSTICNRFLIC